jgi:hypothetical protein
MIELSSVCVCIAIYNDQNAVIRGTLNTYTTVKYDARVSQAERSEIIRFKHE